MPDKPQNKRPGWVPLLRYTHPGYFSVLVSILLMHLALAVDSVDHSAMRNSPSWQVLLWAVDGNGWIYGIFHVFCCGLILYGLYNPVKFYVTRIGLISSMVAFNALAVGFFVSDLVYNVSKSNAIAFVALSLSSWAGAREPIVQPFRLGDKLKDREAGL